LEGLLETDVGLKVIFRRHAKDLLFLMGDAGAAVLSTDVVEVQDLRRTVDCVIKLQLERCLGSETRMHWPSCCCSRGRTTLWISSLGWSGGIG
jgi:hypothetical protein